MLLQGVFSPSFFGFSFCFETIMRVGVEKWYNTKIALNLEVSPEFTTGAKNQKQPHSAV
jgi:hypothetical protein